ncbi:hypothetical protein L596_025790 [Steinernema carpocapsae]|uniref:Uncharacterized protein n=1 Tax=Steinernema carpocapsae TaxID=34508 RepID=A0A4U5M8S8_STECR|nr:hypothetical protein L596_025790 [Steinernema carpocapsae]
MWTINTCLRIPFSTFPSLFRVSILFSFSGFLGTDAVIPLTLLLKGFFNQCSPTSDGVVLSGISVRLLEKGSLTSIF